MFDSCNVNDGAAFSETDAVALNRLESRLAIIRDRVRGVVSGHHTGFFLFGPAGTSKTYTVRSTLKRIEAKLHYYRGHLTPMGLFDLLAKFHDQIIVLDDLALLLTQNLSLQLLLAALGNPDEDASERTLRYARQGRETIVRFSGGIVCISNMELNESPLLQALKSRVQYLRHDPTDRQIAALMKNIAGRGWPADKPVLVAKECLEVANFLISESKRLQCRLDMRNLVDKAWPDFLQWRKGQTENHWHELVTTTLLEAALDVKRSPAKPLSRQDRLDQEQAIIEEILKMHVNPADRLKAWRDRTGGKSDRAFYRRCQLLGRS